MFRKFNSRTDSTRPILVESHIPQQVVDPLNPKMSQTIISKTSSDITHPDFVKDIPSQEDYSLQNLLASGAPLSVINTASMLNSSDSSLYNELAETINNEFQQSIITSE